MLNILTPLIKCTRVSRKVTVTTTFTALPGVWLQIAADGTASDVVQSSAPVTAKLCISSFTGNAYEGNDVDVGRITTLESVGVRCSVDSVGFADGTAWPGEYLKVSSTSSHLGQLTMAAVGGGDVAVAIAEGYDAVNGILYYTTIDPLIVALYTTSAPTTTIAAATTTTTTVAPTYVELVS